MLAFTLCALCTWGAEAPALAQAPQKTPLPTRLRVGTISEAYPYVFYGENGQVDGFAANLIQSSAQAMGLEVEFTPHKIDELIRLLRSGDIDVAIPVAQTNERQQLMDFCVPYLRLHSSAFIRRGTPPIRTVADLAQRRIAVHPGSSADEFLRLRGFGAQIVPGTSVEDSIRRVARGEADTLLGSRLTVLSIMQRDGITNIDPVDCPIPELKVAYSFAVRKGNAELLSQLNEGLAIIMRSGEYERIYDRWYGAFSDHRFTREEVVSWIAALLAVFLLLAFGAYMRQRQLRRIVATQSKEITRQTRWLENIVQRADCMFWAAQITRTADGLHWDIQEILGNFSENIVDIAERRRTKTLWDERLTPERPEMDRRAADAILHGKDFYSQEIRVVHAHRTFWLAERVTILPRSPDAWEAIGVAVDITPLKEAEAAVRHLNDHLEQHVRQRTADLEAAVRELESFSYSVSHDLRAPLRNIAGFATLSIRQLGTSAPPEVSRYLGIVENEAARLTTLIDELLTFSRLSRRQIHPAPVDLRQLAEDVIQTDLRVCTAHRSIEWHIGLLPTVMGDPTLLRQVLANLLSNAVKYTAKRELARIEIDTEPVAAGQVGFFVRDNGAGFDPRHAAKLFGVFQRLHTSKEFEGNGIGLATVSRIVHRHGGSVRGEGRPGEGATFHIVLPAS